MVSNRLMQNLEHAHGCELLLYVIAILVLGPSTLLGIPTSSKFSEMQAANREPDPQPQAEQVPQGDEAQQHGCSCIRPSMTVAGISKHYLPVAKAQQN